jgi:HAMP domain-containing protein
MVIVGGLLAVYGIVGIMLFVAAAVVMTRPLDRIQRMSESFEAQRDALVASLDQAEATIEGMSGGVGRMGDSLDRAITAVDQAAGIASGVAGSMFGLRDSANINIFGQQPFAGLAGSFDLAGNQLTLLSQNLTGISSALDANSADIDTTATNLGELAASVGALSTEVEEGLGVDINPRTIANLRLGIYVLCSWLAGLGVICTLGGLYLLRRGW